MINKISSKVEMSEQSVQRPGTTVQIENISTREPKRELYSTLALPHIHYCSATCSDHLKEDMTRPDQVHTLGIEWD